MSCYFKRPAPREKWRLWCFFQAGVPAITPFFAALVVMLTVAPARAQSLTFHVRSNYPYIVSLSFYSDDRSHAWPGGDQVWILDDYETHTFNLGCIPGEKICLGAWVRGNSDRYWGVGYGARQYCSDCCYICNGGETPVQVLN